MDEVNRIIGPRLDQVVRVRSPRVNSSRIEQLSDQLSIDENTLRSLAPRLSEMEENLEPLVTQLNTIKSHTEILLCLEQRIELVEKTAAGGCSPHPIPDSNEPPISTRQRRDSIQAEGHQSAIMEGASDVAPDPSATATDQYIRELEKKIEAQESTITGLEFHTADLALALADATGIPRGDKDQLLARLPRDGLSIQVVKFLTESPIFTRKFSSKQRKKRHRSPETDIKLEEEEEEEPEEVMGQPDMRQDSNHGGKGDGENRQRPATWWPPKRARRAAVG